MLQVHLSHLTLTYPTSLTEIGSEVKLRLTVTSVTKLLSLFEGGPRKKEPDPSYCYLIHPCLWSVGYEDVHTIDPRPFAPDGACPRCMSPDQPRCCLASTLDATVHRPYRRHPIHAQNECSVYCAVRLTALGIWLVTCHRPRSHRPPACAPLPLSIAPQGSVPHPSPLAKPACSRRLALRCRAPLAPLGSASRRCLRREASADGKRQSSLDARA